MNEEPPANATASAVDYATKPLGDVIAINERLIKDHLAEVLLHDRLVDLDDLAQGLGRRGRGASCDRRSYCVIGHVGCWCLGYRLTRPQPTLTKCAKHAGRYHEIRHLLRLSRCETLHDVCCVLILCILLTVCTKKRL